VVAIDVNAARRARERASEELGISVATKDAHLDSDGQRFDVVAIIPGFGRPNGAVVLGAQHADAWDVAQAQGFFPTIVGCSHETFERSFFEDKLNDLQWFGAGGPPAWYTGQPWS
jgi:hypothetical protein